jgi:hypothetical protein
MVQCRSCLRFPLKSGQRLGIFGYFVRQEFQRDKTAQRDILGLIDHTHPAATQSLDDAVVRDGLADHWAKILGLEAVQVNEGVEVGSALRVIGHYL